MSTVIGEYNLTGVMEMVSVLRLNADSTFQFYFAYGAADREGRGTWILQDSTVILNSKPRPPKISNSSKAISQMKRILQSVLLISTHPFSLSWNAS